MFEPECLIEKLNLQPASMTPLQLVDAIQQIAGKTRRQAAPAYYVQRLGAIKVLAGLAAEKLRGERGDRQHECGQVPLVNLDGGLIHHRLTLDRVYQTIVSNLLALALAVPLAND